jgi:hypothetical protein
MDTQIYQTVKASARRPEFDFELGAKRVNMLNRRSRIPGIGAKALPVFTGDHRRVSSIAAMR